MFRMFVGMIVGAMSAIVAADGPATADRIMMNAASLADQSAGQPDWLLVVLGGWGMVVVARLLRKRRPEPEMVSKYSFLLR